MFFILASVIGIAASVITIKTLIGYTPMAWYYKVLISLGIVFCWFGHSVLRLFHHNDWLPAQVYNALAFIAYVGLGFGFILLVLLIVRDFSWFATYGISKIFKSGYSDKLNPFDSYYLKVANIATVVIALLLSIWSVYEGLKFPDIKNITIQDAKIKSPFKLVMLSDLHINRTTSAERISKLVNNVNEIKPDAIVIVGDLVDEKPAVIDKQMQALSELKAKHGIYTVFGNHDFYSGMFPWFKRFAELNLGILVNSGMPIDNQIYIAGIPDVSMERMSNLVQINLSKALRNNTDNLYSILLSHTPKFTDTPISGVDLQLSGHTHGGQIFPFHLLVKSANKYLSGLYDEDGYKIYVSRGAGFWGPPMRLFAPSEITVINLEPKQ